MKKNTITRRVGGWVLEWDSTRASTAWAIPEHLKTTVIGGHGIMYDDGTMAWDNPYKVPEYVRGVAPQFIRKCQGKRVA